MAATLLGHGQETFSHAYLGDLPYQGNAGRPSSAASKPTTTGVERYKEAIEKFGITHPVQQQRLAARRVMSEPTKAEVFAWERRPPVSTIA